MLAPIENDRALIYLNLRKDVEKNNNTNWLSHQLIYLCRIQRRSSRWRFRTVLKSSTNTFSILVSTNRSGSTGSRFILDTSGFVELLYNVQDIGLYWRNLVIMGLKLTSNFICILVNGLPLYNFNSFWYGQSRTFSRIGKNNLKMIEHY